MSIDIQVQYRVQAIGTVHATVCINVDCLTISDTDILPAAAVYQRQLSMPSLQGQLTSIGES